MAKAYHMIGWTIWQEGKKSTGFGKGIRTLGRSWWKRNKPITVYTTESQCKRYLMEGEVAIPVYVRIDRDGSNSNKDGNPKYETRD